MDGWAKLAACWLRSSGFLLSPFDGLGFCSWCFHATWAFALWKGGFTWVLYVYAIMVHKLVSYCKSLIFWMIIISSSLVSSAASNCCVSNVCGASLPPTPTSPLCLCLGEKVKRVQDSCQGGQLGSTFNSALGAVSRPRWTQHLPTTLLPSPSLSDWCLFLVSVAYTPYYTGSFSTCLLINQLIKFWRFHFKKGIFLEYSSFSFSKKYFFIWKFHYFQK